MYCKPTLPAAGRMTQHQWCGKWWKDQSYERIKRKKYSCR
jgi:hypothetical protein